MPKLFISYRRNDSGDATGRLHDRLKAHFGEESLFYDVDSIPIGLDFRKAIEKAVSQCDVLLAVVGENWVNAEDKEGQRRLDNPNDLVRIEIETALARDIPVVPVLVGNATMPTDAELPGELKGLAHRHAAAVRTGADFDVHTQRLIRGLERLVADKSELDGKVQKANNLAGDDPEFALIQSRMSIEIVIREIYERRIGEPPGNRTLEQLSQRLAERGVFPSKLNVTTVIERLGRIQNWTSSKKLTKSELSRLLSEVMVILKWYMTVEQPDKIGQNPAFLLSRQPVIAMSGPVASPCKIVPKGLRSFDAKDAKFFLELLPGPRDENGLPESVRFWKHRIEEKDDATFTVGVIYGPSGCGKSSLMKAGLLPRLANHVFSVYVESTGADTENRLLNGLRKRFPELPKDLDLTGVISALRQGQGMTQGQKVFIVLDQFEQWLHSKRGEGNTDLAQALRQCDGERVQAVVMVRDDFWLAVSRFMGDLHIELVQGQNIALVDLFDLRHAKNVLAAFGRAFGRVNEPASKEQEAFLDQGVQGLSQDGRVISVRLALFAEMVKGKGWTPAALKEIGGTEGVGVAFLEETFSSGVASAKNRLHQTAVRGVLQALLPEQGSDIKGNMQSHGKLLEASGYAKRPSDFEELLRILDGELRLITPTDPASAGDSSPEVSDKYFQLTHDYLVPSLREWLTRKQKETRRGRAELTLADRAVVWNGRPENRQLPSLRTWLSIRWQTRKKTWTPPQRKMMRKAGRYHAVRGFVFAALIALLGFAGYESHGRLQAHALRRSLLNANTNDVPTIVADMSSYRQWINPLLRDAYSQADKDKDRNKQLHVSLALLPVDSSQVDYLYGRLLDAAPNEVPVIRDALAPHKDTLLERLWAVVERPEKGEESQRLRAAAALAKYDLESEQWGKAGILVVNDLVLENHVFLGQWGEAFRPVKNRLIPRLSVIYRDHRPERTAERSLATSILADYTADQPQVLASLVMDADEKQFAVIFPKLKDRGDEGLASLQDEVRRQFPPIFSAETALGSMASMLLPNLKEELAKRQANAAVALLRMNQPEKVWPLLKHSPDPRVRSYLIHRLSPLGVDAASVIRRLDEEPDRTIRRALLLSLGEFDEEKLSPDVRKALLPKLQKIYRADADPGLHAASEWLLRQWKEEAWVKRTNAEWKEEKGQRQKRLDGIGELLRKDKQKTLPQWYVNGEGQTMVVIPGPAKFEMGSPAREANREDDESQHNKQIGKTFAIAAKSVTVEQYRQFNKSYKIAEQYAPEPDCPIISTSWYEAAAYCNWLSEKEGFEQCYEDDGNGNVTGIRKNYLRLNGYRLPTETEWEYACRAGAVTSRYYGDAVELLAKYAWYLEISGNRSWPVGKLKPNEFGLFDMHGNVWNWCQERYLNYPKGEGVTVDEEDILTIDRGMGRVLRGGSFYLRPSLVRSAYRVDYQPDLRDYNNGFRLARTFTP